MRVRTTRGHDDGESTHVPEGGGGSEESTSLSLLPGEGNNTSNPPANRGNHSGTTMSRCDRRYAGVVECVVITSCLLAIALGSFATLEHVKCDGESNGESNGESCCSVVVCGYQGLLGFFCTLIGLIFMSVHIYCVCRRDHFRPGYSDFDEHGSNHGGDQEPHRDSVV